MLYELNGASVHYRVGSRGITALSDFSLSVAEGEFLTLTGPSGSGKTTVLNLLAGFLPPSSGTVAWRGRELSSLAPVEAAAYRNAEIGMVHQFFQLIPELTSLQNAMLPVLIGGGGRVEARERAERVLERVGMLGRGAHLPSELSGGEQQRVAIARALVNGPRVVLADEPTGNLDAVTGRAIVELLLELCSEDATTMVLVTHDASVAGAGSRTVAMG